MKKEDFDDELSLEKIDDYHETPPEKKRVLTIIIVVGLLVGAIIGGFKYYYTDVQYISSEPPLGIIEKR